MHPDDRKVIQDMEKSYDTVLRKYLALLDKHEELARRQAVLEEELHDGKTGLLPLWEKLDGLARRVEEVARGEVWM